MRRELQPDGVQRPDPEAKRSVVRPPIERNTDTGSESIPEQRYLLLPAPQLYFSEARIAELIQICNSPDIKAMIEQGGVPLGNRYTRRNATSFLKYAMEGWDEDDHYVFFLVTDDTKRRLAGCYELRNRHGRMYETGYWIAPAHRGIGACGLTILIDLCREWNVERLYARALETNAPSRRLLEKTGFKPRRDQREQGPHGLLLYYEKMIQENASGKKSAPEKAKKSPERSGKKGSTRR